MKLPGSPTALGRTGLADLNVDSPRLSPAGEVSLRRGPWRLAFAAAAMEVKNFSTMTGAGQIGNLAFSAGDRLESDLQQTSAQGTLGYRLFEARRGRWGPDGSRLNFGVDAFAGVAAREFRLDVAGPAGRAGVDEWFAEPVAGAGMEIELWKQVSIDLKLQIGAAGGYEDKSIGSGTIEVDVGWRPWENVGLAVGYRLEAFGLNEGQGDDAFEVRSTNAGLMFGVTVRF